MSKKSWYKSKTIIFNVTVTVLAAAEAGTGILQPLLPINFYTLLVFSLPVINAGLRVVSSASISR